METGCIHERVYKVANNVNVMSIQDCVQGRQGYYNNYIYIYIYILFMYEYTRLLYCYNTQYALVSCVDL